MLGLGFLASHLLAQHRHLSCSWPALFFVASGRLSRSLPQGAAISVAVGWACWANCFRWRYQEVQNNRKMWERSSFIRQLMLQAVNAQSHRNRTLWAPQEKRWPQLSGSRLSKLNTKQESGTKAGKKNVAQEVRFNTEKQNPLNGPGGVAQFW